MQVSRLAEQNAALQEEVRQLRAQKGSGSGSDDVATLHAVNAQLAEENAVLSSSCDDLERRLAGEGGSSSGSNGPTRDEVRGVITACYYRASFLQGCLWPQGAESVRPRGQYATRNKHKLYETGPSQNSNSCSNPRSVLSRFAMSATITRHS